MISKKDINMDFYVIPPLTDLGFMHLGSGNRYFCLAQFYWKYEEYRTFFKRRVAEGCWVTLDNGAGDHNTETTNEQLMLIIQDLFPSEVIPLDVLHNKELTIKNLNWMIDRLESHKDPKVRKTQILACPQGSDLKEWMDCYDVMLNNPSVTTIGMSKIAIPHVVSQSKGDNNIARDRNTMFLKLKESNRLKKPLHFLGAGEIEEFALYKGEEMCRSTDSCFTVWSAINDQILGSKDFKRIPTPKNYFYYNIHKKARRKVMLNTQKMKELLS